MRLGYFHPFWQHSVHNNINTSFFIPCVILHEPFCIVYFNILLLFAIWFRALIEAKLRRFFFIVLLFFLSFTISDWSILSLMINVYETINSQRHEHAQFWRAFNDQLDPLNVFVLRCDVQMLQLVCLFDCNADDLQEFLRQDWHHVTHDKTQASASL